MRFDDFCNCYFGEFESIYKAWCEMTDHRMKDGWERTRTLAAICVQPYAKKTINPRQLVQLPWDKHSPRDNRQTAQPDGATRRKRMEEIARRMEAKV